jgi:hypothetical protein
MATKPKPPQQMYEEITAAFAQAELVGDAMQDHLERKVQECNQLAAKGQGGSEFMKLEYAGEKDATGRWHFSVKGKLQRMDVEVNPKPGRIGFTVFDEHGERKGAVQLLKIDKPAGDLPEYLAASVVESVIEGCDFKA